MADNKTSRYGTEQKPLIKARREVAAILFRNPHLSSVVPNLISTSYILYLHYVCHRSKYGRPLACAIFLTLSFTVIEAFDIQPGTALATEINRQLSAAEALALRESKLTSDDLAKGAKLFLVSRGGNARATFVTVGSLMSVYGTCNKDGAYVCFGKQEPPTQDLGPFEFVVECRCIKVYQSKQLVWQCGHDDDIE